MGVMSRWYHNVNGGLAKSMVYCKATESPVRQHCGYHSLASYHRNNEIPQKMVGCTYLSMPWPLTLHWRHNYHDGVSNHQPHGCLLNRLFSRKSKKTSKLRVTGLCAGNSPGPMNSPHKGPVTQKMFPFDDVIMEKSMDKKIHFRWLHGAAFITLSWNDPAIILSSCLISLGERFCFNHILFLSAPSMNYC